MTLYKFKKWLNEGFDSTSDQIIALDNYGNHTWIFFDVIQNNIIAIAVDPRKFFDKAEFIDQLELEMSTVASPELPGATNNQSLGIEPDENTEILEEFVEGFKDPILVGFNLDQKKLPSLDSVQKLDISFLTKNTTIDIKNISAIMASIKKYLDFGKF